MKTRRRILRTAWIGALAASGACGCRSTSGRTELQIEIQELRAANQRLTRAVEESQELNARMARQVADLQTLGSGRPVAAFAPSRIEIASLSGGTDFDGRPGDDGIAVYLRPLDTEGDAIKAPGRIRVQVLDTSRPGQPRVLAVCTIEEIEPLRQAWHGKFGTNHYTLRCPFDDGASVPDDGKVVVIAEFLDYLSGMTLTATREVSVKPARDAAAQVP